MAYDADQEALRGVAYMPLEIEDPPEPANSRRASGRESRHRSSTRLGFRSKRDYNEFHEFHEFQATLDQESQAGPPSASESRLQASNLHHRLGAAEIDVHPNLNSRFGAAELDVQLGPPDLTEEGAREEVGEDWRRVGDVDGFMRGVYEYYCGRGFVCIVTSWVGRAADEGVAEGRVAEGGLAEGRVVEGGVAESAAEAAMHEAEGAAEGACDVLKHAIRGDVFRHVTVWEVTVTAYLALLCLYWLLCFAHFFLRLPALLETRALFRHRLRLSDHQLLMTPWPAVVARLVRAWNAEGAGEREELVGGRAGGGGEARMRGEEDSSEDEEEGEPVQQGGERHGKGLTAAEWLDSGATREGGAGEGTPGGISGMGVVGESGGGGAGGVVCGGRARVGGLSAYEVAARITRRDNYLVALVDSRLLTVRVPAGGGSRGSGSTGAALAAALLTAVGPLLSFHVVHEKRRRKGGSGGLGEGREEEREEGREGREGREEEGCVRVTVLSKTLEWVVHWCVLHPLLDRHGRLQKHFLDDPAALRQRFMLSGWVLALLSPFVLLFVLSFFLLRKAHHLYHEPAAAGVRSWSNLARWMFKEYNEVDHLTSQRLDAACPRADEYLAQFPSPLLSLAAKLLSFVAGSLAALLLALALADEKLLEAQLFGRGLVWYAAILGAVLAAARPVAQADRAAGSVDPKGALLRAAQHTHFLPSRWRNKAHTQRVRDEFQTLYQLKPLLFFADVFAIFITPFILWFILPQVPPPSAALPCSSPRLSIPLVHLNSFFLSAPSYVLLPFAPSAHLPIRPPPHPPTSPSAHLPIGPPPHPPTWLPCHPIPQRADAILSFLRSTSTYHEGLGHVCSHSAFHLQGEQHASSSRKSGAGNATKGDSGRSGSGEGGGGGNGGGTRGGECVDRHGVGACVGTVGDIAVGVEGGQGRWEGRRRGGVDGALLAVGSSSESKAEASFARWVWWLLIREVEGAHCTG
ncbi:unnamed protein product [Closterium sp. Yama58-4]|nr:unnamed protein product [Closterium sp. Yama58-4]